MNKEKTSRQKPRTYPISAWNFVGREVEKLLNEWPTLTVPVKESEIVAIMVIAMHPGTLAASLANRKAKELARVFGDCYANNPEVTLALLKVIRDKWNQSTVPLEIQRHLGTKAFHTILENGELRSKFTRQVTDGELLNKFYSDKKQHTAKTLAAVKKSRQRMQLPVLTLHTTRELRAACVELEEMGLDTGMGRTH